MKSKLLFLGIVALFAIIVWSATYANNEATTYKVRKDDTLWDIDRALGTNVSALQRINNLQRGARIYVGQKLRVPSDLTKDVDNSSHTGSETIRSATPCYSPGLAGNEPNQIMEIATLKGHGSGVYAVAFSPDGRMLASGSPDQTVKLWDVERRIEIGTLKGHGDWVFAVAFSPDGRLIASGSDDKTVKLWDVERRKVIATLRGHGSYVRGVAFSPDGRLIASCSYDKTIKLWDVERRKLTATLEGNEVGVKAVAFSPDGKLLVHTSGQAVKLWDVERLKVVAGLKEHATWVNSVAFTSDGKLIATGSLDKTVKLWDVDLQKEIAILRGHLGPVNAIAFSPNGRLIASGSEDKTVKLWDVKRRKVIATLKGHGSYVRGVAFSPDGRLIASGSSDKTVKLWDVSAVSGSMFTENAGSQPATPDYPPVISGSIAFREPSGNNILDAGETGTLVVSLTNTGQGEAHELTATVSPEAIYRHLIVEAAKSVPKLDPSQSTTLEIPISASIEVATQQVGFTISVSEVNGFDLDPPLKISFGTQEFLPPALALADYAIEDFNHNRKIERSEIVQITARVQNRGTGEAQDTRAVVSVGLNVFITQDSKITFDLGKLAPGEYEDIVFSLFANNKATSLPVTIVLTESYGKYGAIKELNLPFEVIQKAPTEMVVEGTFADVRSVDEAPELVADVDRDIPRTNTRNRDAIAVVIGNRDYACGDVPAVEYAVNDASVMRSYLTDLLGYEEGNIIYLENASLSQLRSVFGTEEFDGQLANMVKDSISDVFVYYSGHGAPDPNSKKGYFLPVDCCPNDVRLNGYPLETFYENMGKLTPKSLTIVIDACFSGGSNQGMLIRHASPISIEIDNPATLGRSCAVFTSSAGDEISSWYPGERHGLFTYFFLKGLRKEANSNGDRKLTSRELYDYLSDPTRGVPYYARSIYNGRVQTPTFSGDSTMVVVEY